MPFITNDIDYKFVDDKKYVEKREDFDEKGYVKAQKLYVQSIADPLDVNHLLLKFKKYGEIESIEVQPNRKQGYVTFSCDRSAHGAFLMEKDNGVEIAYTWKQPSAIQNNDKIFRLAGTQNEPTISLADARKILKLTGPRFNKILIHFTSDNSNDTESNNFTKVLHVYLKQIAKHCNPREDAYVPEMRFEVSFCRIDSDFVQLITPIFAKLHSLTWNVRRIEVCVDVEFSKLCPNLKILKLFNVNGNDYSKLLAAKPWPSLETFFCDASITAFYSFLKVNSQLKRFKGSVSDGELPELVNLLPNIEEMDLNIKFGWAPQSNLLQLKQLQRLRKLTLFDFPNDRRKIECLSYFSNLAELGLQFPMFSSQTTDEMNQAQEMLVSLARQLGNLKQYFLAYSKLNEKTVIEIVQSAKTLKALHLHECHISLTDTMISELADARKLIQEKLYLCIDNFNRNDLDDVNINNAEYYLNIKQTHLLHCDFLK